MLRLLQPDLVLERAWDLSPERLRALGLSALLLDVDCTLQRYRVGGVLPEATRWLAELSAAGVGLCLVSNGRPRRIAKLAAELGLAYVGGAMKPLPFGCRRAMRQMGFQPRSTAMVGDQIFADVLAGALAGVRTILVLAIHPEDEPWYTRWKRPLEQLLRVRRMRAQEDCKAKG